MFKNLGLFIARFNNNHYWILQPKIIEKILKV